MPIFSLDRRQDKYGKKLVKIGWLVKFIKKSSATFSNLKIIIQEYLDLVSLEIQF